MPISPVVTGPQLLSPLFSSPSPLLPVSWFHARSYTSDTAGTDVEWSILFAMAAGSTIGGDRIGVERQKFVSPALLHETKSGCQVWDALSYRRHERLRCGLECAV